MVHAILKKMQTTGKKVITRIGLTYAPCMDTYTNIAYLNKCVLATSNNMFEQLLGKMREECREEPWGTLYKSFWASLFNFLNLKGDEADQTGPRLREEIMKEVMDRVIGDNCGVIRALELVG